jgi:hypothetical protein
LLKQPLSGYDEDLRGMTDNHWGYRKTKAVADVIADLGAVCSLRID